MDDIKHTSSWTLPKYLTLTYFSDFQGQIFQYTSIIFRLPNIILFHLLNFPLITNLGGDMCLLYKKKLKRILNTSI